MDRIQVVEQTDLGVYLWKMPDGRYVTDSSGSFMLIESLRGDLKRIRILSEAAKHFGAGAGRPVFVEGARPVSESEHEEQKERMRAGDIPDPYDIGVYRDYLDDKNST